MKRKKKTKKKQKGEHGDGGRQTAIHAQRNCATLTVTCYCEYGYPWLRGDGVCCCGCCCPLKLL
jgi:hypothetical protein